MPPYARRTLPAAAIADALRVIPIQQLEVAVTNDGVRLAQGDELAIAVKRRIGAGQLLGGVDLDVIGVEGNPGGGCAEARAGAGIPLHRGAGVVAADGIEAPTQLGRVQPRLAGTVVDRLHIAQLVRLPVTVGHGELLPLIDEGGALHQVQHHGPQFGAGFPPLRAVVTKAGDGAGQVVVAEKQAVPAPPVQPLLVAGHGPLEGEGVEAG